MLILRIYFELLLVINYIFYQLIIIILLHFCYYFISDLLIIASVSILYSISISIALTFLIGSHIISTFYYCSIIVTLFASIHLIIADYYESHPSNLLSSDLTHIHTFYLYLLMSILYTFVNVALIAHIDCFLIAFILNCLLIVIFIDLTMQLYFTYLYISSLVIDFIVLN